MKKPLRRHLPLLFLGLLAASFVGAQPQESEIFIDRVDVNVVNVEVFVTDGQGRRVTDLTADDFEVYEDGRQVEISNFYKIARADRVETAFEEDRALVGGQPRPAPPEIPKDQQLNLLVYFDNYNLRPGSRNRVIADMQGFVEDRLNQGDNVMLVTYTRSIEVLQPFTRDREALFESIGKIRKMAGYREITEAERREAFRNVNFALQARADDAGAAFDAALDFVEVYIQKQQDDLQRSINALQQVTRSLAGLPGRKAVLYVSDGLDQLPGQDLYQHLTEAFTRGASINGRKVDRPIDILNFWDPQIFQDIVADANAHQVTFYTLDAGGSSGSSLLSAENEQLGSTGGGLPGIDAQRTANLQAQLIDISERTGGTAIRNTTNFDGALETVSGDFDSFYSLGYRSPRGGDGKYHKIEVKVNRPGLRVRHRNGYVDKPEGELVADRTLSSLLLDLEANPLGINIDFGKPEKVGRKQFVLPMIIRIPVRDLTLLPQGDEEQGRLSIFLAVRDEEGGISKLHKFPLPISFPSDKVEEIRGSEIGYRTNLKLEKGTPKIAVGVWDELSGTESFVHKRVQVEKG